LHIASHMVQKYPHVHKAFVDIESLKWSRIPVQGIEHKYSFVRDGEEKRLTNVEVGDPSFPFPWRRCPA
jgi:urate oxidase